MGLEDELNEILDKTETASEEKLAQIRSNMVDAAKYIQRQVEFLEAEGIARELAYSLVIMWYAQGHLPLDL